MESHVEHQPDASPASSRISARNEVSLLDTALLLVRNAGVLLRSILIFLALGLIVAFFSDSEYTTTAKVVRESQTGASSLPGGLSTLQGLGIGFGSFGMESGLTPEAFPEILESREVRLGVVRDTFYFPSREDSATYTAYANQEPGLLGQILAVFRGDDNESPTAAQKTSYPSKKEEVAIRRIQSAITSAVSTESGIMSISVTAPDPMLSASLCESVLRQLEKRVREVRTKKAAKDLAFVEERFREANRDLEAAENRLAGFLERNQQINSPQLQFERDRLRRQVGFKEQLYRDLQKQLTQARFDLQRKQPVITVIERPVPPLEPSAPNRLLIMVIAIFLGGALGLGLAFVNGFLSEREGEAEQRKKLNELRDRLRLTRLFPNVFTAKKTEAVSDA